MPASLPPNDREEGPAPTGQSEPSKRTFQPAKTRSISVSSSLENGAEFRASRFSSI